LQHCENMMTFQLQSLQLRRLLHCMSNIEDDTSIPDQILQQQLRQARSMFDRVHAFGQQILTPEHELTEDSEDVIAMVEYLQTAMDSSCQLVEEKLEGRGVDSKDDPALRMINHIFFDEMEETDDENDSDSEDYSDQESLGIEAVAEGEGEGDLNGSGAIDATPPSAAASHAATHTNKRDNHTRQEVPSIPERKLTPEEMQKEQEEMLNEEITNMASQLKNSSLNIKSTLSSQNVDLEEMETLAQSNLDKTKDVTEKVTAQVRSGWRKGVGRWITFFIIIGTWIFCFLTIRITSKRQGACLFFCDRDRGRGHDHFSQGHRGARGRRHSSSDYEDYRYDSSSSSSQQRSSQERKSSSNKKVGAKYSYCKEASKEGKHCTTPEAQSRHSMRMERFDNEAPADEAAFDIAEGMKEKRYEENLARAQKEGDNISSSRVRDGWSSESQSNGHSNKNIIKEARYANEESIHDDYAIEEEGFGEENYNFDFGDEDDDDDDDFIEDDGSGGDNSNDDYDDYDDDEPDHLDDIVEFDEELDFSKLGYEHSTFVEAVLEGDIETIALIMRYKPEWVNTRDDNGWEALHEAGRSGDLSSIKLLIERGGADINARTGDHDGGSILWWASQIHPDDHPAMEYLISLGAISIAPGETIGYKSEL